MFMIPTGEKCPQCKDQLFYTGVGESITSDEEVELYRCMKLGHIQEKKLVKNKHDHKYENK